MGTQIITPCTYSWMVSRSMLFMSQLVHADIGHVNTSLCPLAQFSGSLWHNLWLHNYITVYTSQYGKEKWKKQCQKISYIKLQR